MRKLSKQAGVAHLFAVLAIAVVVIAGAGWYVVRQNHHKTAATTNITANAPAQTANPSSSSAVNQPLASGTSNTALNSDLQNLNSSLNQDSQNLSSANQSFSDKQLVVSD